MHAGSRRRSCSRFQQCLACRKGSLRIRPFVWTGRSQMSRRRYYGSAQACHPRLAYSSSNRPCPTPGCRMEPTRHPDRCCQLHRCWNRRGGRRTHRISQSRGCMIRQKIGILTIDGQRNAESVFYSLNQGGQVERPMGIFHCRRLVMCASAWRCFRCGELEAVNRRGLVEDRTVPACVTQYIAAVIGDPCLGLQWAEAIGSRQRVCP